MSIKAKGVIIFYINVGMLSPIQAEALVHRIKDQFFNNKDKDRDWELPDDVGTFFVPVRNRNTKVQYINFDKATKNIKKKIEELKSAIEEYSIN